MKRKIKANGFMVRNPLKVNSYLKNHVITMKELAMKLLSMIKELTPAKSPAVSNKSCESTIKKQKETSPEMMPPRKKL